MDAGSHFECRRNGSGEMGGWVGYFSRAMIRVLKESGLCWNRRILSE